jgi:hypothetical protein
VIRALPRNALRVADEVTVVAFAMAGDDDAYGELVRRRQDPIWQLFRRVCRDPVLGGALVSPVGWGCSLLVAWRAMGRALSVGR